MKQIVLTLLAGLVVLNVPGADAPYKLQEAWATEAVLDIPEGVLFNPVDQLLYVSNISGPPFEKNGKGFISKVDLNGKITDLKWATGLHAPKGMAIHGNHLYVTDIDILAKIDLSTGKIAERYPAEGAVSLNDVAADREGIIYVSDSRGEACVLYRLKNGRLEPWFEASQLGNINGLHMLDGRLLAGHAGNGTLYSINLKNGKIKTLAQIDTGIDGLKPVGDGAYLTSDWKGRITLITSGGKGIILQDTSDQKINAADFEYLPDRKLLIVPTFYDNRLVAYDVEKQEISIGDKAPAFKAVDQDGKPWSLQDHLGKKHIVIYFYPAAMTGGCTKQACSYRDHIKQTADQAFEVVGISGDTPINLKYFRQAEGLNFTLLSDPAGDIAKAFGVPVKTGEKSIMRTVDDKEVELKRSATTARWTFIIDPQGKIVYRNDTVKAMEDLNDVLVFLKTCAD